MASISIEGLAKSLNKYDIYPGISSIYSAPARCLIGLAQIITGLAKVYLGMLSRALGVENSDSSWEAIIENGVSEICHGVGNMTRGNVAVIPLIGNLVIYLYEKSPLGTGALARGVVLERGSDGLYTLPNIDIPEFRNRGTVRARELRLQVGDFHIDTENGIVPKGWVLKK